MAEEKKSLYERFDDAVMTGVNAGVRAWNWTTGRTKSDLANTLLTVGCFSISVAPFFGKQPASALFSFGIFIPYNYLSAKMNNLQVKLGEDALSRSLKSMQAENGKNKYVVFGPVFALTGAIQAYEYSKEDTFLENTLTTFGVEALALSDYVMRAENLPPRKNVFSRAADKLREHMQESQVVPQPALVPAHSYSTKLDLEGMI